MSDITVEDCIKWLDAKWSRHGELEDKEAAYYLRQLADTQRKLEAAEKAVVSMVEDGWLMHGPEGMSEPQQLAFDVYQSIDRDIEQSKGGDDD